jgi:hypothetical protein
MAPDTRPQCRGNNRGGRTGAELRSHAAAVLVLCIWTAGGDQLPLVPTVNVWFQPDLTVLVGENNSGMKSPATAECDTRSGDLSPLWASLRRASLPRPRRQHPTPA